MLSGGRLCIARKAMSSTGRARQYKANWNSWHVCAYSRTGNCLSLGVGIIDKAHRPRSSHPRTASKESSNGFHSNYNDCIVMTLIWTKKVTDDSNIREAYLVSNIAPKAFHKNVFTRGWLRPAAQRYRTKRLGINSAGKTWAFSRTKMLS